MKEMPLTKLKAKQSAIVKQINAGINIVHRLEPLGIRPGKKVTKITSHFWKGPITVLVDRTKIAIGYGMALKIIVEVGG